VDCCRGSLRRFETFGKHYESEESRRILDLEGGVRWQR
jgi:hypothetical protein